MIVVSDSSPLIGLAAIDRLELLRELYGEVRNPLAVYDEVVAAGAGRPGAEELGLAPWIVREQVRDDALVRALLEDLDRGEAEAIALAAELAPAILLVDERRGRAAAKRLGLHVIGVLGVLLEAKAKGLLPSVAQTLEGLTRNAGFRIGSALREAVLRAANEPTEE